MSETEQDMEAGPKVQAVVVAEENMRTLVHFALKGLGVPVEVRKEALAEKVAILAEDGTVDWDYPRLRTASFQEVVGLWQVVSAIALLPREAVGAQLS